MIFTGKVVKEVLRDGDEDNWVASAGGERGQARGDSEVSSQMKGTGLIP